MANYNKIYHTLTVRILHWIITVLIGILIFTGLYISNPLGYAFFSTMDTARKLHFVSMYFLITGTFIRGYYCCINKDYRQVFFRFKDIKQLPGIVKYYLFLSSSLPGKGRYNPGQKVLYNGWDLLILLQAATGFMLYSPVMLTKYAHFWGGFVMVRQIHFMVTWVFVITILIHVYLAFLSGWPVVKSMFTGVSETKAQINESIF